jgi:hypothetical protein
MLSEAILYCYAERHYHVCHYAECRYAECHHAECRHAECRAAIGKTKCFSKKVKASCQRIKLFLCF